MVSFRATTATTSSIITTKDRVLFSTHTISQQDGKSAGVEVEGTRGEDVFISCRWTARNEEAIDKITSVMIPTEVPTSPSSAEKDVDEIHDTYEDTVFDEVDDDDDEIMNVLSRSARYGQSDIDDEKVLDQDKERNLIKDDKEDDDNINNNDCDNGDDEDEYIEEEIIEEDDSEIVELDYDATDDESSVWVDDGRDHTKDPDIIQPFFVQDYVGWETTDAYEETANDFFLELPNTTDDDELSSLGELDFHEMDASTSEGHDLLGELMEESESLQTFSASFTSLQTFSASFTSLATNKFDEDQQHTQPFRRISKDWGSEDIDFTEKHHGKGWNSQSLHTESLHSMSTQMTYFQSQRLEDKHQNLFCGRHEEMEMLKNVLTTSPRVDRKKEDTKRCIWIHGPSGIGKTALTTSFINTLIPVARNEEDSPTMSGEGTTECFVARGSFGEHPQSHKPLSGFMDCLDELVLLLIQDNGGETSWAERIRSGLGKDIQLLVTLIPNAAKLLGINRSDPISWPNEDNFDIATSRLFHRSRFALRRFFRVVCHHRRVVLFLDDLHRADDDSLAFIEAVLSTHSLNNFFCIGCHCRIKPSNTLHRMKSRLSWLCAAEIGMTALKATEVRNVILKFLKEAPPVQTQASAALEELSEWMTEVTKGHPLHLYHCLSYLEECEMISVEDGKPKWDMHELKAHRAVLMSVHDIISERLERMPTAILLTLKGAAFLGVKDFDLKLLFRAVQICLSVEKTKDIDLALDSMEALAEQVTVLENRQFLLSSGAGKYAFSHDIVSKAAVRYLPTASATKMSMHHEFATYQEAHMATNSTDGKALRLALICHHYSYATERMKEPRDKQKLVRLKLILARGAIGTSAFSTASYWLDSGLSLLKQGTPWKDAYNLSLKVHIEMARVKFCQGNYNASRNFAREIIVKANIPAHSVKAYELLICLAIAANDIEEAFRVCLEALKEVFNDIPSRDVEREVASMEALLQSRTDEDLASLPEIVHKKYTRKVRFLTRLAEISWMKQDFLSQDLAALKMMEVTISYGISGASSLAFVLYGMCLARRNRLKEAFRFGCLGSKIAGNDTILGSQATAFHHYSIAYWRRPLHFSLIPLHQVVQVALDSNDMENISFRVGAFLSLVLATGIKLNSCDSIFRKFKEHSVAFHARETWLTTVPFRLILQLRDEPVRSVEKGFDMYNDARAIQYGTFFQMIYAVFMDDTPTAEELSIRLVYKPEGVWLPLRGFYEGLIATSLARNSTGKPRLRYIRKAEKIVDVLSTWAKKGLRQGHHMANLISCDLRMLNDASILQTTASSLYDAVIDAASEAGFVHHEALANERAGLVFSLQDNDEIAEKYLARACELYHSWGAIAKVRSLLVKYNRYFDASTIARVPSSHDDLQGSSNLHLSLNFGESQMMHFTPISPSKPGTSDPDMAGRGRRLSHKASRRRRSSASLSENVALESIAGEGESQVPEDTNHSGIGESSTQKSSNDEAVDAPHVGRVERISRRKPKKAASAGNEKALFNATEHGDGKIQTGPSMVLSASSGESSTKMKGLSPRSARGLDRGSLAVRTKNDRPAIFGFLKNIAWRARRTKGKGHEKRNDVDDPISMASGSSADAISEISDVNPSVDEDHARVTGKRIKQKSKAKEEEENETESGRVSRGGGPETEDTSPNEYDRRARSRNADTNANESTSTNGGSGNLSVQRTDRTKGSRPTNDDVAKTGQPRSNIDARSASVAGEIEVEADSGTAREGRSTTIKRTNSKRPPTDDQSPSKSRRRPRSLTSSLDAHEKHSNNARRSRNLSVEPTGGYEEAHMSKGQLVTTSHPQQKVDISSTLILEEADAAKSNEEQEVSRTLKKARSRLRSANNGGLRRAGRRPRSLSAGIDPNEKLEEVEGRAVNADGEKEEEPAHVQRTRSKQRSADDGSSNEAERKPGSLNIGLAKPKDERGEEERGKVRRARSKQRSADSLLKPGKKLRKPRSLSAGLDARGTPASANDRSAEHDADSERKPRSLSPHRDAHRGDSSRGRRRNHGTEPTKSPTNDSSTGDGLDKEPLLSAELLLAQVLQGKVDLKSNSTPLRPSRKKATPKGERKETEEVHDESKKTARRHHATESSSTTESTEKLMNFIAGPVEEKKTTHTSSPERLDKRKRDPTSKGIVLPTTNLEKHAPLGQGSTPRKSSRTTSKVDEEENRMGRTETGSKTEPEHTLSSKTGTIDGNIGGHSRSHDHHRPQSQKTEIVGPIPQMENDIGDEPPPLKSKSERKMSVVKVEGGTTATSKQTKRKHQTTEGARINGSRGVPHGAGLGPEQDRPSADSGGSIQPSQNDESSQGVTSPVRIRPNSPEPDPDDLATGPTYMFRQMSRQYLLETIDEERTDEESLHQSKRRSKSRLFNDHSAHDGKNSMSSLPPSMPTRKKSVDSFHDNSKMHEFFGTTLPEGRIEEEEEEQTTTTTTTPQETKIDSNHTTATPKDSKSSSPSIPTVSTESSSTLPIHQHEQHPDDTTKESGTDEATKRKKSSSV